jgi:hypothetical protein
MQKWIKPLTGLFVLQLVLVVVLNASALKGPSGKANTPLLTPSPTTASKVVIQAQNEDPITLVKAGETWTMPEYYNLAVNPGKLEGFLEKLSKLQRTWPEATTSEAQSRFEVAEDKYQRRISLYYGAGGDESESIVYLGTSPGYLKTHARLADSSEIYSVSFSNYEASSGPETWFNTNLLKLELERINRIETPDYILEQIEGDWRLADLSPSEAIDEDAVKVFVTQLANISVEAVLTDDADSDIAKQAVTSTLKAFMTGNEDAVQFQLALAEDDTHYILKSSQSPLYFRLPKAQGDRLVEVARSDLVTEAPVEAAQSKPGLEPLSDETTLEPNSAEESTSAAEDQSKAAQ